jgi:type III secretion protein N (ATPase)
MARIKALDTATAVSEWFRDQHRQVLLLVDSLTRVLRARRELGLALGEPPARDGFPASAFAPLPGLVERTGNSERGAITAIYTVLTEGNIVDPVAEEARSLLDGHILLSEKQANAGIWPAVDVVRSISRVFGDIAPEGVLAAATDLKRMLAAYEENEDLILMGAYRRGASPDTDRALARREGTNAFLGQKQGEISPLRTTFGALKRLVDIE